VGPTIGLGRLASQAGDPPPTNLWPRHGIATGSFFVEGYPEKSPDKLVYMANQIGKFFRSHGGEGAVKGTAEHLKKFWGPGCAPRSSSISLTEDRVLSRWRVGRLRSFSRNDVRHWHLADMTTVLGEVRFR
jgi:hypothetical protein